MVSTKGTAKKSAPQQPPVALSPVAAPSASGSTPAAKSRAVSAKGTAKKGGTQQQSEEGYILSDKSFGSIFKFIKKTVKAD